MQEAHDRKHGQRPKIQYTEQEIHDKALEICRIYSEAVNSLETICHHHKINDRTFRRWINQYPQVREYYNEALTLLKETKSEKMGVLATTGQEKLLIGPEYITTNIIETYDNDGNRTGYTKSTTIRQLPPNVQMVKFTLSNYDKKNCQLKPWGDDNHDNNSYTNRQRKPSILWSDAEDIREAGDLHGAEDCRETQEFKDFLKWKETNNLQNARYARTSPIIYKDSPDITESSNNESAQTTDDNIESGDSVLGNSATSTAHPNKTSETWKQATSHPENEPCNPPNPEHIQAISPECPTIKKSPSTDTFIVEFTETENNTEINDYYARNESLKMQLRQKHEEIRAAIENHQTEIDLSTLPITRAEFEALMHARWGNPSDENNPDKAQFNSGQNNPKPTEDYL